jgi:Rieske Fe-S protein
MTDQNLSRRTLLGAGGAGIIGVGLLGVAGCSASKSSGGSGPVELAKLSDVPVGGSLDSSAKVSGNPVVVSQKAAGTVSAFSAICTHMGCTVKAAGAEFHCPCHGSVYDAFTGQVVHGPAPSALSAIPATVSGGRIVTG